MGNRRPGMVTFSIFDAARDAPNQVAVAGAVRWTYTELAEQVDRWISGSVGRPYPPVPLVAVVPQLDAPSLVAIHGLLTLGVPMVMVHPRYTPREREHVIRASGASWLCDRGRMEPVVPSELAPPPDGTLAIVATSGTTGRPKLAVLSRDAFAASARSSEANLGWQAEDRWLLSMPLSHVGGLSVVTRTLLARRALVLPPPGGFDEAALLQTVEQHGVTLMSLVPTMLHRLVSAGVGSRPQVRAVLLGGAPASSDLVARALALGWPILTTYGLTEACSQVATCRLDQDAVEAGVGAPLPGFEVRLVDGQIWIRGSALMSGYLGEPSPFLEGGWLPTGDLGFWDESGNLHVRGRRSDLIISGGENVYPAEVEAALRACPGIDAVCVFGVDDPVWGQRVALAVVGQVEIEELARYCDERLAPHRRPRLFCRLPSLTTLGSGKVDRKATIEVAGPMLRPLNR